MMSLTSKHSASLDDFVGNPARQQGTATNIYDPSNLWRWCPWPCHQDNEQSKMVFPWRKSFIILSSGYQPKILPQGTWILVVQEMFNSHWSQQCRARLIPASPSDEGSETSPELILCQSRQRAEKQESPCYPGTLGWPKPPKCPCTAFSPKPSSLGSIMQLLFNSFFFFFYGMEGT